MGLAETHQIVVVGAGVAGLSAARRLVDHGLDVVVLEARDRVGGRLWSHRLQNGEVVELGGEWISTGQSTVMSLAAELGLGLVDTGMDFISRDPVGGPSIPSAEHSRLAVALAGRMREIGSEGLASMTAADLIDGLGESGPAMTVLRSRLQGTAGAPLEWIAAGEIGEEFGIGDEGSYVRIDGGNDRLAIELVPGIDLRTQCVVTGVRQDEELAHVLAGEEVYVASAVILAVPLAVLRDLEIEPGLPPDVVATLANLRMGMGAKVAIATDEEPPLFRRQDMDVPAWYWTGHGSGGTVRRAITGFGGSEKGVRKLLDEPIERLRRAAPECAMVGEPVISDWAADSLAGGCYSVIGPGQRSRLDVLAKPCGRIILAGEHVNGSGTIDGAILSGEAAARAVLTAMVS